MAYPKGHIRKGRKFIKQVNNWLIYHTPAYNYEVTHPDGRKMEDRLTLQQAISWARSNRDLVSRRGRDEWGRKIPKRSAASVVAMAMFPTEGPRRLPTLKQGNKTYFVDERLKEIRNINNPHDAESVSQELIEYWKRKGMMK